MSFVLKRGISAISTLTSQQTFKALCSHLPRPPRHPLRRPLRRPPQIMSAASQPPISGYDALAQRFSSYSKPPDYTDIQRLGHNYNVGPTEREMETEISWIFGIEYLARATEDDAERKVDKLYGYMNTERRRLIVPCVISNGKMACWVHCIVIPGAYGNYLSGKVNAPTYAENILSC
jgi:hypothetical protein